MRLNLKETPEEKAERAWRKNQRRKRKAKGSHAGPSSTTRPTRSHPSAAAPGGYDYVFDVQEENWRPSASYRPDSEHHDNDESRFRSRLFDAMAEDAGSDERHSSYSSFIPSRWHRPPDGPGLDMNDDAYAEWVRQGMWRRLHSKEVEEQKKEENEKEEKRQAERRWREAERKLERDKERKREQRVKEGEERGRAEAWQAYERGWLRMSELDTITWADVPWPTFEHPSGPHHLTAEAIKTFLLSVSHSADKSRKERHREALLRWHPDKFEGRWMTKMKNEREKDKVREGVSIIVRCLGEIAEDKVAP